MPVFGFSFDSYLSLGLQITLPVRVFAQLGAEVMMATNACGGLNSEYNVGDLMIIKDHINLPGLAGFNPLIGYNDSRLVVICLSFSIYVFSRIYISKKKLVHFRITFL